MEKPKKIFKCSFDFDGTLELPSITAYAKELMLQDDVEVYITTSRFGDDEKYKKFFLTSTNVDLTNRDLWELAAEIGIPKERIHFTDMSDKWHYIKRNDFLWHLDDDWVENRNILKHTKTMAISSYGTPAWKSKCERILKKARKNI